MGEEDELSANSYELTANSLRLRARWEKGSEGEGGGEAEAGYVRVKVLGCIRLVLRLSACCQKVKAVAVRYAVRWKLASKAGRVVNRWGCDFELASASN
jgi:hypothetical protein